MTTDLQSNTSSSFNVLRVSLIKTTLEWEKAFGVAPHITSALSELDAAILLGFRIDKYSDSEVQVFKQANLEQKKTYSDEMQGKTAVNKGYDFMFKGRRFQVKANRPSGKIGSKVTLVPKASNYNWDYLVWILYNQQYQVEEAWMWSAEDYKKQFHDKKRLSPNDYRRGLKISISVPFCGVIFWNGIFDAEVFSQDYLKRRNLLADSAKGYAWHSVIDLIEASNKHPTESDANVCRPSGATFYTPLHQAARAGAPIGVVEKLLQLGAWKTLRTVDGYTAYDIAVQYKYEHLYGILQPEYDFEFSLAELKKIEENLHNSIKQGPARDIIADKKLRLPSIEPMCEKGNKSMYFKVYGAYGGYKLWIDNSESKLTLYAFFSSRVFDEGGYLYKITEDECRLLKVNNEIVFD